MWNILKVNNKNTRKRRGICSKLTIEIRERRQLTSFWCFHCWFWTYFTPFFHIFLNIFTSASNVLFEQVIASWDRSTRKLAFYTSLLGDSWNYMPPILVPSSAKRIAIQDIILKGFVCDIIPPCKELPVQSKQM